MSHVDWERVLAQVGRVDVVAELLSVARADWPGQLRQLETGVTSGDREQVLMAAHSLKGSAALLGGRKAAQLAGEIERRARFGELEGLGPLVAELAPAMGALGVALEERLRRETGRR